MLEYLPSVFSRGDIVAFGMLFISVTLGTLVLLNIVFGAVDLRRRAVAAAQTAGQPVESTHHVALYDAAGGAGLSVLLPSDELSRSELRKFLHRAGFESRAAPVIYQLVRILCAVLLGFGGILYSGTLIANPSMMLTLPIGIGMAALGFYLPRTLVSLRRDSIMGKYLRGFPDFLDLMVICADAGVGVESAIDRVSGELTMSNPELAHNLRLMSLELRAGRSRAEALDNLAERLGIEEARSFATLLQQSEELGTSLVQALRVYSDEMRAKRFARAEEKAMGLPAKLVLPLGFCVFPVILAIVLVPLIIKISKALGVEFF